MGYGVSEPVFSLKDENLYSIACIDKESNSIYTLSDIAEIYASLGSWTGWLMMAGLLSIDKVQFQRWGTESSTTFDA
ncbi:Uncharacterised protein [Salmonella enterica]|uniref:Uncharacterized protein n=1 Tax=Salmonella enterica subsp. arizonae TaxID=59203 RepID=A0A379XIL1_SALER|nr:Uncharacterised protein [Salmonella enterica]SUG27956.1 Uncharacterised protein [Salmonella enterica subsp. arizonae]SUH95475.1 Uncharacterised protein [Salmonella enterica subsp. arizonae]